MTPFENGMNIDRLKSRVHEESKTAVNACRWRAIENELKEFAEFSEAHFLRQSTKGLWEEPYN